MLQNSRAETEQAIRGTCLICKWLENLEYLNLVVTGVLTSHWGIIISVFHSDESLILKHFAGCL